MQELQFAEAFKIFFLDLFNGAPVGVQGEQLRELLGKVFRQVLELLISSCTIES